MTCLDIACNLERDVKTPNFGCDCLYRDYAMPGGYRKILVKPGNLTHKIIPYDDYQLPLTLTDLDILNGTTLDLPTGKRPAYICALVVLKNCIGCSVLALTTVNNIQSNVDLIIIMFCAMVGKTHS